MQNFMVGRVGSNGFWKPAVLLALLALPAGVWGAATESPRLPVVPKWHRFEQSFKSATLYSNALQDATLLVVFTSPIGETNLVYGFWDGDRTWRVRFSPDQVGRWTFKTTCSDTANRGLHNRTGELICSAATRLNPFHRHGPVQAARDHRHLEHADGTPFFWLADTTWDGPRRAAAKDWEDYIRTRAQQQFSVIQWAAGPGEDTLDRSALGGFPDRIAINPEYFQGLDARLELVSEAGLLSAIVPLLELGSHQARAAALADDQVALLVRYVVARWGADPVIWLLAFDGESPLKLAERWRRIGQAVFGDSRHAPVLVYPGAALGALEGFRNQVWVDLLGCPFIADASDAALAEALTGPFAKEWMANTPRPLIPFLPVENAPTRPPGKRFTSDDVRRAACWSLVLTPPAGISYGGQGVVEWDASVPALKGKDRNANLPLWKRAMFMPAAKQMGHLADLMTSVDFWLLRPQPKAVAPLAGGTPGRVVAACTEAKDLVLAYLPEGRSLDLVPEALPPSPVAAWLNPRDGQSCPATATVAGNTCQFAAPADGDWLLLLKAGKR